MRGWVVSTLLRKELIEVVRDRRSLFLMLVLPLLLYPLLFLVTTQVAVQQIQKIEAELVPVAVSGWTVPQPIVDRIGAQDHIQLVAIQARDPKALLASGEVRLAVLLPETLGRSLADEEPAVVTLLYDETDMTSNRALDQLRRALQDWADELVVERLDRRGLGPNLVRPFDIERVSVAPPQKVGGHLLGQIVPLLIVMMVVLGAFYPAIEVTAGEKERGTLQTLLTAPVAPLEIIFGKFVSVFCVAAITAAANIASIAMLFGMVQMLPEKAAAEIDLGLGWATLLLVFGVAILIGLMFSAIMMTVAVLARTFKEAQAYMTPVYLLCVMPVVFAQLPGMELEGLLQLVPGLNQALLLREIFEGTISLQHIFAVVVSTAIYTIGTLIVAARIFEREAILLGEVGIKGLFQPGVPSGPIPRPGQAFALCAVIFVLLFYVGSVAQAWHLIGGLAITQWILIGVPVLLFIRLGGRSARQALGARSPPARAVISAGLLGAAAWYPLMFLASLWETAAPADPDDPAYRMMEELLQALVGDATPVWLLLGVVALSPAVCEELLFRGVVLRSMQGRFRTRTIVLVTALLFGAFHMSAARFLPTSALGVVLALLALRSGSILPCIVFHFLHNGLSVLLARYEVAVPGVTVPGTPVLWQAGLAVVLLALGTWLLVKTRPEQG